MAISHSLKDLFHVVTEIITRGFYMARSHSLKDLSHVVTEINKMFVWQYLTASKICFM